MTKKTMKCPECGRTVPMDAVLCPDCGNYIDDTELFDPEDPEEPFPVGEGTWVLLLMAAAYGVLRLRMLRSAVAE